MIRELDFDSDIYFSRANEYDTTGKLKEEVIKPEELISDLKDTLKSLPDKTYLCANEIGLNIRAFCVKFGDEYKVFINPMFQTKDKIKLIREVYYPTKKEYIIPRFTESTICYQNESCKVIANKLNSEASIVFNQAVDCLDGIHVIDYGLEIIPEFDEASEEERLEVIEAYLDNLQNFADNLDEDLQKEEEIKDQWDYFKYLRARNKGEIEIEKVEAPEIKMNRAQRRSYKKLFNKLKRRKKND